MPRRPNFMIVITDQQSGNPYWPERWEEENLPAMRWLKNHGINFKRAPESVVHFLETYDSDKPFCLIVSLVNPHDVLAYPGTAGLAVNGVPLYQAGGYRDEEFVHLPIDRPPTWNEDLSTKPRAQSQFRIVSNAGGGPITADDIDGQLGYCRFYAYLAALVDKQIVQVLESLNRSRFADDTFIVRISDHGDMAMTHGLQRQKMFNMYEETLNVPFIISHPHLFKEPQESEALVSLIDLLPTLANLAGVPDLDRWVFKGKDLTPILSNPRAEVQGFVHFTYEDLYFFVPAASHIRAIVEKRWKYAVYYDIHTNAPFEYEMYDLDVPRDQREVRNLGHPDTPVTPEVAAERERLHQKLIHIMETLGTLPHQIEWPEHWGGQRAGEPGVPGGR